MSLGYRQSSKEREQPEWLKFINSLPACPYCGVVVGACLLDIMAVDKKVCPKEETDELAN